MKKFKVTSPEGKTLVLTSQDDAPPSEQELEQIFQGKSSAPISTSQPGAPKESTGGFKLDVGKAAKETISDPTFVSQAISGSLPQSFMGRLYSQPREGLLDQMNLPKNSAQRTAAGLGLDLASDTVASKVPGMAGGVLKGLGEGAERVGGRFLNSYIKPRQAGFKFGRNPGQSVAKLIGPSMTKESLLSKIQAKNIELLSNLEESVKDSKTPVDISSLRDAFKKNIEQMSEFPETFSQQIDAHKAFANDLDNIVQKKGFMKDGKYYLTPSDALKLKRQIGKLPSWSVNDPRLGTITKTSREAYGAFDKAIDQAVPGSAQTNQDISNLIGAEQGLQMGMQRDQNKSPIGLLETLAGLGFGGGNLLSPKAIAAMGTVKALKSAPFNTTAGAIAGHSGAAVKGAGEFVQGMERPSVIQDLLRSLLAKFSKANPVPSESRAMTRR